MSNKVMNYAIHHYKPGNQLLKLVFMLLADQADDDGLCWPSQERLADQAEVSERTIRRAVSMLEERGDVEVYRKTLGTNRSRNRYVLKFTEDKLSYVKKGTQDKLSGNTGQPCPVTPDIAMSYKPIGSHSSNNVPAADPAPGDALVHVMDWKPSPECVTVLVRMNQIPEDFVEAQLPDFLVFYLRKTDRNHWGKWDNKFMASVRRRWVWAQSQGFENGKSKVQDIMEKMTDRSWAL